MADIKDVLDKAQKALDESKDSDLQGCKYANALLGIGYALLGMAMIIEDVETADEEK